MAETVCLFGPSGAYKTTQMKFLARRVYQLTGKVTRWVSTDGGGWKPAEDLVRAGIIEPWDVSNTENLLSVMRKLSKGYWPEPQVVNGQDRLVMVPPTPETWKRVGAYVWEGWTSTGQALMRHLTARGQKISEDVVSMFSEKVWVGVGSLHKEEEERFSAPARAHYNFVQKTIYELTNQFRTLPVSIVGMTALESKGEEEDTRRTILGPSIEGIKAVAKAPAWVGDLLHHDDYLVEVPDPTDSEKKRKMLQTKVRIWFVRHPDATTGIQYPAKPRLVPEMVPKLLERFPGGFFEPTTEHGLDLYLDAIEEMQSAATKSAEEWRRQTDEKRKKFPPDQGAAT